MTSYRSNNIDLLINNIDQKMDDLALVISELATLIIIDDKEKYIQKYFHAVTRYEAFKCEKALLRLKKGNSYSVPETLSLFNDIDKKIEDEVKNDVDLGSITDYADFISRVSKDFRFPKGDEEDRLTI